MDIVRGGRFTATCVAPRLKTKHVGMTFGVATEFPEIGWIAGASEEPQTDRLLGRRQSPAFTTLSRGGSYGGVAVSQTVVIWDSGRNDQTQPRRADDMTCESGNECAIRCHYSSAGAT